jgi:hypothetical protein
VPLGDAPGERATLEYARPAAAAAAGPGLRTEPLGALPVKGKGELPVFRCVRA